jgi:dolichol-phosphate mannosyltransferase
MRDEAATVDIGPTNLEGAAEVDPPARGGLAHAVTADETQGAGATGWSRAHIRLVHGMRRPANWLQLVRFSIVGASGFAVNLVLYDLFVKHLGIQYLVAEAAAWILAAANNFIWNRHWTFKAREGLVHVQAMRFLLVSLLALGLNLVVLRVLVESAGLDKLVAEVLALGLATPLNFLGNKLWSFRVDLYSEPSHPPEE